MKHILIVNQHGDNRGDEAALSAMLQALDDRLAPVRFTVLHQFRSKASEVAVPQEVRWVPLRLPLLEVPAFVLYLLLELVGRKARWMLGPSARAVIEAYENADLMISAPGGPYFGDIYAGHEPVHWLYVWMSRIYELPSVLYAPSAGPFRRKWMNPFRRFTYRSFTRVTLREERSASMVRELMAGSLDLEVTADSALQAQVGALERSDWVCDGESMEGRFVLVVSAIDYPYSGDRDPDSRRANYDRSLLAAVVRLCEEESGNRACHVAFVPQLHSAKKRDAPYLESLARGVPDWISTEVVDETLSAGAQRARFAAADAVIAGRYHPAVFAISARVPVLCVPYEHKATGVMVAAGIGEHVLELDDVTPRRMADAALRMWAERDSISAVLSTTAPELRARASRTSDIVAEVVDENFPT